MIPSATGATIRHLAACITIMALILAGAAVWAQQSATSEVDPRVAWGQQRLKLKEQGYLYVGNVKSYKLHKIDCRWAKRCFKNCKAKFKTREEAIAAGFEPCKVCKP
jgi:hypothetical protein